jgi:competence protein ComEC
MIRPVFGRGPAPALAGAAALVLGVLLGAWSLSGAGAAAALAFVAAAAAAAAAGLPSRQALYGLLAFASLGFFLGRVRIGAPAAASERALAHLDLSRPVTVEGRIADFWVRRGNSRRCRMEAAWARQDSVRVRLPAPVRVFLEGAEPIEAFRGDVVSATGRLRREDVAVSERDIPAPWETFGLRVKSAVLVRRSGSTWRSLASAPNRWLEGRLAASGLDEQTVRGPIEALLLGRTGALDDGTLRDYRRGGMYHLLVISGLHVALVAGAGLLLLGPFLSDRRRDLAVLLSVAAFAVLAGGRAPVVRAAATIGVLLLARVLERPVSLLQAAGLSAILVVAMNPREIFGVGFLLTYAAALAIAVGMGPIARRLSPLPQKIRLGLSAALAAQLGTTPLVLWRFNLLAGLSWLGAPLALPLVTAMLAVGALILAACAAGVPVGAAGAVFTALARSTQALAETSGRGSTLVSTPPLWFVPAMLAALLWVFRGPRRGRPAGAAAYALLLGATVIPRAAETPPSGFTVEALDVGQGDAILVRAGGGAFLVDGGGPFDTDAEEFGRTRLLPKLLDRGVTSLDGVLLSHPHPDHALGLFAVLRELPVGSFLHGRGRDESEFFARLERVARQRGIAVRRLSAGDRFPWRGGTVSILWAGGTRFKADPVNNESVVALYERSGRSLLLTGDAGRPAERRILDAGAPRRIDVLKVGHHGSRTSTGRDFLAALSPRAALLSCGRENPFHHPAPDTIEALRRAHVPVYRTDLESDVGFRVTRDHVFLLERGLR